ncbi:MAG TPA: hypothetical protein VKH37_03505 [Ferruginibacter sp.]|nr:hypothetical protein [Ferruginibacter sp.]
MKKIIIAILSLCLGAEVSAQQDDAFKELQKIRAYYDGPELKHIAGQMLLTNKTNSKAIDKVDFEYWIKDKSVFTKMNYVEIFCNDKVYIMVNHQQKSIYARAAGNQKRSTGMFDASQFQQLLNAKGVKTGITKSAAGNQLKISGLSGSNFSDFTITYDPADNKLRSISANVINADPEDKDQLVLTVTYTKNEKSTVTTIPAVLSSDKYGTMGKDGVFHFNNNYQAYTKL